MRWDSILKTSWFYLVAARLTASVKGIKSVPQRNTVAASKAAAFVKVLAVVVVPVSVKGISSTLSSLEPLYEAIIIQTALSAAGVTVTVTVLLYLPTEALVISDVNGVISSTVPAFLIAKLST